MKITKNQLKQIIKEELGRVMSEEVAGSYPTTGVMTPGDPFKSIEINGVTVGAVTNAGKRPSYAIAPINARGKETLEQFKILRAAVEEAVTAGQFADYSQVLVDPAPRNFGQLMVKTKDGKTEYKNFPLPDGVELRGGF